MGKLQEKFLLFKVRSSQDAESYGKLYDLYVDSVYRFILFKVSDKDEAQDLTSDVFLKGWSYLLERDDVKHFRGLIFQIARNTVIDHYRKKGRKNEVSADELLVLPDEKAQKLFDQIGIELEYESIYRAMQYLKDQYREVIVLRYIEQYSIKEIAEIVGKKQSATKVLLHRATKKLKEILGGKK